MAQSINSHLQYLWYLQLQSYSQKTSSLIPNEAQLMKQCDLFMDVQVYEREL